MGCVWNVMLSIGDEELYGDEELSEDDEAGPRETCEPLERINAWIPHGRLVSLIGPTYADNAGYGMDAHLYGGGFGHFDIEGFIEVVKAQDWKARSNVQLWVQFSDGFVGTEPFTEIELGAPSEAALKATAKRKRSAAAKAAPTKKQLAVPKKAAATRKAKNS